MIVKIPALSCRDAHLYESWRVAAYRNDINLAGRMRRYMLQPNIPAARLAAMNCCPGEARVRAAVPLTPSVMLESSEYGESGVTGRASLPATVKLLSVAAWRRVLQRSRNSPEASR